MTRARARNSFLMKKLLRKSGTEGGPTFLALSEVRSGEDRVEPHLKVILFIHKI
jgi:hypothetical protein